MKAGEPLLLPRRAGKHASVFRRFCGLWWIIYDDITRRAECVGDDEDLPEYARMYLKNILQAKRKAKRRALRAEVLTETGGHCVYCDRHAAVVELTIDHIVPLAKGGASTYQNFAPACVECNRGKGDSRLNLRLVHPAWKNYIIWKTRGCRPHRSLARGNIRKWT